MPDPVKLQTLIRSAVAATRSTPGRLGRTLTLPADTREVIVAGDLHGHVGHFQTIFQCADLAKNPYRHLVLQELIHSPFRYPDDSDKSHQLIDLFCMLKSQFPARVHYVPGNHELAQRFDQPVIKNDDEYNDLFRRGITTAYGPHAQAVYDGYLMLFDALPLAIRLPNRVFLSHSLPRARNLEAFDLKVLEADAVAREEFSSGGSVHSLVWGRDTSEANSDAFLKKVDADRLVTGHIVQDEGFAFASPRHLIVDGSHSPAAFAMIPTERVLTDDEFRACVRTI